MSTDAPASSSPTDPVPPASIPAASTPAASNQPVNSGSSGSRRAITVVVVVAVLAALGWRFWPWRGYESTDDASIEARVVAASASISARVLKVLVEDNQHVDAGALLVELDAKPQQARLDEAQASLALAQATLAATREAVELARVNVESSKAQADAGLASAEAALAQAGAEERVVASEVRRSEADRQRYAQLASNSVTAQQLDRVTQTAQSAAAQEDAGARRVAVAQAGILEARAKVQAARSGEHQIAAAIAAVSRSEADVKRSEAQLREAQLMLSYCQVVSPISGRVTKKSVEPGAFIQMGQGLMAVVGDQPWVVANLKESQLRGVRVGAVAIVHVDAYPGVAFGAHVDSIQAGSGTRFSLLPPENATGNFVKVIQRVPVKLVFDQVPDPAVYHLGPGMSVQPLIQVP
jgi:membrane fusion protein (multidrug efflux system)